MKELIKLTIKNCEHKPTQEKMSALLNLYDDLEARGWDHKDIFVSINDVIFNNINRLAKGIDIDKDTNSPTDTYPTD